MKEKPKNHQTLRIVGEEVGTEKKPKNHGTFGIVLAVLVVLGIINAIGSTSGKNTANKVNNTSKTDATNSDTSNATATPTTEHFEVNLTAGNYVAGFDIPAGTYNLTAVAGNGNVSSSNLFSGGINEIMGTDTSDKISVATFNGLKLDKSCALTIGSTVTIDAVSENAQVATAQKRANATGDPIDLAAGNYTAGTDFPAGTYTVVAKGSSGNVSSSNLFSGGLNEILSIDTSDGISISQFNNADFPAGTTLTISGTSIQLVPVGSTGN